MRAHEIINEGLIVIPPHMHEEINFYLTYYVLWWARDRFRGKTKQLPKHYAAFKKLVAEFGERLPDEAYKPSKDMSVHVIRMNTSDMPLNYQQLHPTEPDIRFALYWLRGATTLGVWRPDKRALMVYPYALDYLARYPCEANHPDDLAAALDALRETVTHELRHMVQYMLLGDHPEQRAMKSNYAQHGDDYFTSPVEFDPTIGSSIQEFVQMWNVYSEDGGGMDLKRAIMRYTGAVPTGQFANFATTKFFRALKRTAPERWKVAVRKFVAGVGEALKRPAD